MDKKGDGECHEGRSRNNTVLRSRWARGICFLFSQEKLPHQDSLQQSAEIWNQYLDGSFFCQGLKLSSHKYFRKVQWMRTEPPRPHTSPQHPHLRRDWSLGFLFFSYLITAKFCQLVLEVLIAVNRKSQHWHIFITRASNSTKRTGKSIQRIIFMVQNACLLSSDSDSTESKVNPKQIKSLCHLIPLFQYLKPLWFIQWKHSEYLPYGSSSWKHQ